MARPGIPARITLPSSSSVAACRKRPERRSTFGTELPLSPWQSTQLAAYNPKPLSISAWAYWPACSWAGAASRKREKAVSAERITLSRMMQRFYMVRGAGGGARAGRRVWLGDYATPYFPARARAAAGGAPGAAHGGIADSAG